MAAVLSGCATVKSEESTAAGTATDTSSVAESKALSIADMELCKIYEPDFEARRMDDRTGFLYVNNIVAVIMSEEHTKEDVQRIAEYLSGEVEMSVPEKRLYLFRIEPHNFNELCEICEEVEKLKGVEVADIDNSFYAEVHFK